MSATYYEVLQTAFDETVSWRRYLHQNPELSFQETNTSTFIANQLTSFGLDVKENVGGNGVVGVIQGEHPGKTIAFRADFDALPIHDEKDVPYKSTVDGVMHACGHDAHVTMLLGAAKILKSRQHLLKVSSSFSVFSSMYVSTAPPTIAAIVHRQSVTATTIVIIYWSNITTRYQSTTTIACCWPNNHHHHCR